MAKKETWADLRRRARWDRIAGAGAVLLLLMILMINGMTSCVKKHRKNSETDTLETLPAAVQPTTEKIVDNSMAVYLSPSTQEDNLYACDGTTTEEKAMWDIALQVKDMLEADHYVVYMCGEDDKVPDKIKEGNSLRCGAYVSIHSNSSGESGKGQGTECYYNSEIAGSLALAENIYNRVAALTPTEDRGLKDQTQRDLYEIFKNVVPCCLLEVEFHDDVQTSQWILDHTQELAQSITDGIESYLDGTKYNPPATGDFTEPYIDENYAGDH